MGKREYLGDSVYAESDGYGIILTTNNGMGASNTIYLEPEVMSKLSTLAALWKKTPPTSCNCDECQIYGEHETPMNDPQDI